jgi:hypothetical protein
MRCSAASFAPGGSLPFSTSRPRLFSICERALEDRGVEIAQHDGVAVLGEDLGDAVAHGPRPEDPDLHYLDELHI